MKAIIIFPVLSLFISAVLYDDGVAANPRVAASPIVIDNGRQLFVDDYLITATQGEFFANR